MEKDFEKTTFYRSFMTCVFAGLIGTVICIVFDLVFVQVMKFPLSSIINVSTLIFTINTVFLLVGFLFYWSLAFKKGGEVAYILLFTLVTGLLLLKIHGFQRSTDVLTSIHFRWLSSSMVVILGAIAAIIVPLLYRSKVFDEYVL